ncbi:MAG: polysaccharide biosynthesis C-terminal domain-containing protein [Bacteroidota bacterium]
MSLIRKLAGETVIYGLSTIIGRALNALLVPLYTYTLLDSQYGVVAELYALVGFLNVLFVHRMETAMFRYGSKAENRSKAFQTSSISVFGSTILLVGALLLSAQSIANWLEYPDQKQYVIWFALIMGFDALSAIPFARLRLEGKAIRFVTIKLLNIGINIGLNLFFLVLCPYMIKQGYEGWSAIYSPEMGIGYIFIANLVASAVTVLLLLPTYFSDRTKWQFDRDQWRIMFKYAAPLVLVGFAGIVNEMLDRVLLKQLLEGNLDYRTGQIGIYSANYKIAMLITLFTTAFTYAAEPFFFRNADRSDAPELYATVAKWFTWVACFGMMGILLFIDLFKYYVGPEFREGLDIIPILLLANVFLGLYYNLAIWFKLTDKTIMGAYIAIGGALITILANWFLIPILGYRGSAWATLLCYFCMLLASYWMGKRHYPIPYPLGRIASVLILAMLIGYGSWAIRGLEMISTPLSLGINTGLFFLVLGIFYQLEKQELTTIFRSVKSSGNT